MHNFTVTTTVVPTGRRRTAPLLSGMNAMILGTTLIAIVVALPANALAADINNVNRAAAMEKQRALNKANLAKLRHFDRKPKNTSSLKLDALPQSPRRGANSNWIGALRTASIKSRRADSDLSSIDD